MNRLLADRRSFVSVAALLLAGGGASRAFAQVKPEKSKVTIAVGSKASLESLPLAMAERLGYFAAEGMEVDLAEYGPGGRTSQSAAEGADEVFAGAFEQIISLQSRNQLFRAFVLLGRAPQVAMGICTKTMPAFKTIADLRGRRLGVVIAGSAAYTVARSVLMRGGVAPQDVIFVELPSAAAAMAAVRTGQLDAISCTEPIMSMLEHRVEVRVVADTRSLSGSQQLFGGPMASACVYASSDYVQKNPKTVQALSNAVVHALKWLQTAGPSDIIKQVPEDYLLGDRSVYLASFNKVREAIAVDGVIPDDGAKNALRVMARMDGSIHADKIDLGRTFTNDFSRKAKDKFRA